MDILLWVGLVVAALISVPAVLYVVWPLLQPGPTLPLVDNDRLADLLVRKDILLRAIKDLEFDHEMGKVALEDYTRFSARLRRQALGIMQQIDKIAPESAALDAQLEAEIAALRKLRDEPGGESTTLGAATPISGLSANGEHRQPSTTPAQPTPQETPSGDATALRFCTECGKPVGSGYKFCAECGAPIVQKVTP